MFLNFTIFNYFNLVLSVERAICLWLAASFDHQHNAIGAGTFLMFSCFDNKQSLREILVKLDNICLIWNHLTTRQMTKRTFAPMRFPIVLIRNMKKQNIELINKKQNNLRKHQKLLNFWWFSITSNGNIGNTRKSSKKVFNIQQDWKAVQRCASKTDHLPIWISTKHTLTDLQLFC